jgi:hypothetical protein
MNRKTRGYYRVLIVENGRGHLTLKSRNVIGEHFVGRSGIRGVTAQSSYYLGGQRKLCERIAAEFNAGL